MRKVLIFYFFIFLTMSYSLEFVDENIQIVSKNLITQDDIITAHLQI